MTLPICLGCSLPLHRRGHRHGVALLARLHLGAPWIPPQTLLPAHANVHARKQQQGTLMHERSIAAGCPAYLDTAALPLYSGHPSH